MVMLFQLVEVLVLLQTPVVSPLAQVEVPVAPWTFNAPKIINEPRPIAAWSRARRVRILDGFVILKHPFGQRGKVLKHAHLFAKQEHHFHPGIQG